MNNDSLSAYVYSILGTLFGLTLAAYAYLHWARNQYGKLLTCVLGAAIVGYCIYDTKAAINILRPLGAMLANFFTS